MADDQPHSVSKPLCIRADALAVLKRLRDAGHLAYFAGGCVRDLLLGLEPKDYDIATDASPQRVRQLFSSTQAVGAAFGVILVRHHRSVVEVATFRAEGPYLDGRRPSQVHFTGAEEDARRRDFTINGLFLDPLSNRVIDYVGGQADLEARVLRAIGNPADRFQEDHLRLLRAVRFAARFSLQIEPGTAQAIRDHAPMLVRISPERIADELRRMLTPVTRQVAWPMLWEFGLVHLIFRFLPASESVTLVRERSIFLALPASQAIPFGLALAAAVLCYRHQVAPGTDLLTWLARNQVHQAVRAMRQALRISNEESDQMQETLLGIEPLLRDPPPTLAARKRFLARPTSRLSRLLMEAMQATGHHAIRIASLRADFAQLERTDVAPPPLITGDDLAAAGLQPGPSFKRILDRVYDAQLEDRVTTRDAAMALAMGLAKQEP